MKQKDGVTVEIDPALIRLLESADWTQMRVQLNNNGCARVLLSSKKGQYASLLLDWDSKLLECDMHSVDMDKSPHNIDKYNVYH